MAVAIATRAWTIEELDRLPEDGNTYEVIHGELFVTPPPNEEHETLGAYLNRLIDPFVAHHGLGLVYRPHAVVRVGGSQVEPDLMVRAPRRLREGSWINAPLPSLIVEIVSPATRRRDHTYKRDFYREIGVAEYWIVDAYDRTVTVIRPDRDASVEREQVMWSPSGAPESLAIDLGDLFGRVATDDES